MCVPAFAEVPQSRILLQVIEQIHQQTHRRIRDLQAIRHRNAVIVSGSAPSYHVVQLAIVAALSALRETPLILESRLGIAPAPFELRETANVVAG